MIGWLVAWVGVVALAALAICVVDLIPAPPRPGAFERQLQGHQERPAPAPRPQMDDVVVEVDGRRSPQHRALAGQTWHREDLLHQRTGLRELLAAVEGQLDAHQVVAEVLLDEHDPRSPR